jgi:hypothetical protein
MPLSGFTLHHEICREQKKIWDATTEEAKRNENDLETISSRMKEASEQIAFLSLELQKSTRELEAHRLEVCFSKSLNRILV